MSQKRTGVRMKPVVIVRWFCLILILLLSCRPALAGSAKIKTLDQKIHEISILQVQIIDKIDQAVEMRTRLQNRLVEMHAEIRTEQIRAEIYSHPAAMQNLRIRHNLSLIQTLQAYINLLDERVDYFQSGNERLKFLMDQINDDLAIINILKDMEIQTLIDRINLVLDEFIPEMQKQIFNAVHMRLLPIEYVWEEVSLKPN